MKSISMKASDIPIVLVKYRIPRFCVLTQQRHNDCRRPLSPVLFPAFRALSARFAFAAPAQKCLASPPSSLSSAFLPISGLAHPLAQLLPA